MQVPDVKQMPDLKSFTSTGSNRPRPLDSTFRAGPAIAKCVGLVASC